MCISFLTSVSFSPSIIVKVHMPAFGPFTADLSPISCHTPCLNLQSHFHSSPSILPIQPRSCISLFKFWLGYHLFSRLRPLFSLTLNELQLPIYLGAALLLLRSSCTMSSFRSPCKLCLSHPLSLSLVNPPLCFIYLSISLFSFVRFAHGQTTFTRRTAVFLIH